VRESAASSLDKIDPEAAKKLPPDHTLTPPK
jgi:hypothetical protein